jgi:SEC-C motif
MSKKFPVNAPCPCGSGKKYKKCHGSVRTAGKTPLLRTPETFGQNLIAYTDESGNSGSHLFDPNQPEFWTGTLVVRPNFEAIAAPGGCGMPSRRRPA